MFSRILHPVVTLAAIAVAVALGSFGLVVYAYGLPVDFWSNVVPTAEQFRDWRGVVLGLSVVSLTLYAIAIVVGMVIDNSRANVTTDRAAKAHADALAARRRVELEMAAFTPRSFSTPAAKGPAAKRATSADIYRLHAGDPRRG